MLDLVKMSLRTGRHLANWIVWHARHVTLLPDGSQGDKAMDAGRDDVARRSGQRVA